MPRNEEGEFELILGNRQLLSVFFIVVILLGVFFTMGYIVGRNSSPLSAADAGRRGDKPIVVDPTNQPTPRAVIPPAGETPAAPEPARENPAPPVVEKPRPEPAKSEPPKAAPKAHETASPVPDQPQAGQTYLQIAAMQRAEAELFVDVLGKKGFHALYVEKPDQPGTFRVLVGPLKDAATIVQARSDLQKAGFQGNSALVRKY